MSTVIVRKTTVQVVPLVNTAVFVNPASTHVSPILAQASPAPTPNKSVNGDNVKHLHHVHSTMTAPVHSSVSKANVSLMSVVQAAPMAKSVRTENA